MYDFNPRPPWGGRPRPLGGIKIKLRFQSTPSVGRATISELYKALDGDDISIHALRGEGDGAVAREMFGDRIISIHALRGEGDYLRYVIFADSGISIHALRGEGDAVRESQSLLNSVFQSTPSVGRATRSQAQDSRGIRTFQSTPSVGRATSFPRCDFPFITNFNPRPPWGGRPLRSRRLRSCTIFQSTPSVGRATSVMGIDTSQALISIHALRGEGDLPKSTASLRRRRDFNPRPPWGGRQTTAAKLRDAMRFQSTPSVGRATSASATT